MGLHVCERIPVVIAAFQLHRHLASLIPSLFKGYNNPAAQTTPGIYLKRKRTVFPGGELTKVVWKEKPKRDHWLHAKASRIEAVVFRRIYITEKIVGGENSHF